jgi:O-acetyl-ADP-ribose deacetylase
MTKISVIEGDITQVDADALITAVNSGGMWFGGIDSAITRVAGDMFHSQIMQRAPLNDGDGIYAGSITTHGGAFKDVIFVIDELSRPVETIVLTGLELAVDNELKSVTIPTIRTGVMAGVRETRAEALIALADAVTFYADSLLDQITIVVYDNQEDLQLLNKALSTSN